MLALLDPAPVRKGASFLMESLLLDSGAPEIVSTSVAGRSVTLYFLGSTWYFKICEREKRILSTRVKGGHWPHDVTNDDDSVQPHSLKFEMPCHGPVCNVACHGGCLGTGACARMGQAVVGRDSHVLEEGLPIGIEGVACDLLLEHAIRQKSDEGIVRRGEERESLTRCGKIRHQIRACDKKFERSVV